MEKRGWKTRRSLFLRSVEFMARNRDYKCCSGISFQGRWHCNKQTLSFFLSIFFALCNRQRLCLHELTGGGDWSQVKRQQKPMQTSFLIFILHSPKKYPLPQHMSGLPAADSENWLVLGLKYVNEVPSPLPPTHPCSNIFLITPTPSCGRPRH